jgi:hypothetical protein
VSGIRKLPDPAGPGRDLLVALCDLYLHAGEPSMREIAHSTGDAISRDTVHRILRCERVPRWRPLELVVKALGGDVEAFRALWVSARRATDAMEKGSD